MPADGQVLVQIHAAGVNQLDSKIQEQLQKAKDGRETAERQAQAKVRVLEAKAAAAKSKAS